MGDEYEGLVIGPPPMNKLEDMGLSDEIYKVFKGLEEKVLAARDSDDHSFDNLIEETSKYFAIKHEEWSKSGKYKPDDLEEQLNAGMMYLIHVAETGEVPDY